MRGAAMEGWIQTTRTHEGKLVRILLPPGLEAWQEKAFEIWSSRVGPASVVRRHDWGGSVSKIDLSPGGPVVFLKRFKIRSWRYLHKPRRARQTLLHEIQLQQAGFGVPRILALFERRALGVVMESGLLSEEVQGFRLYDLFNQGPGSETLNRGTRRRLFQSFGQAVGRLHKAGFYHGDLQVGNVLCRPAGQEFEFVWMDNERGRRFASLPLAQRIDDLNQVNKYRHQIRLTERMRLWQAYVAEAGLSEDLAAVVLRGVVDRSRRFWRKRGWT